MQSLNPEGIRFKYAIWFALIAFAGAKYFYSVTHEEKQVKAQQVLNDVIDHCPEQLEMNQGTLVICDKWPK